MLEDGSPDLPTSAPTRCRFADFQKVLDLVGDTAGCVGQGLDPPERLRSRR
ncbi:hypothetical protein HBB16_05495 [Pseudonocardia sp. MCCB 268]|nr:hypothetical protein [Pseudonocardia cytotoxica]